MLRGIYPVCLLKVNSRKFGRAWLSLIIWKIRLNRMLVLVRNQLPLGIGLKLRIVCATAGWQ
jgi:hypothetical protein